MDKIKLRTHDGSRNYLQRIDDSDNYILKTQFDFIRGGQVGDGREFVDPSGGPMLVVGDTIDGTPYKIEKISRVKGVGIVLTLTE